MEQYHKLLEEIKSKGTYKSPARENMPGTISLFGAQFRHDLSKGFPLLTTKKLSFKNIVIELIWFLKGDTNIKFLVENGCNIWNEDAYNYYLKSCKAISQNSVTFEDFVEIVRRESVMGLNELSKTHFNNGYIFGDCGIQYGKLWRDWGDRVLETIIKSPGSVVETSERVDQLYELILGLKKNPESRRHIITAWNPATLNQMALNACHALVQFNCRPLSNQDRYDLITQQISNEYWNRNVMSETEYMEFLDKHKVPKYYLDCQMYQRSSDIFLGVPYNTASYSLLTEIIAKFCNMIPGEFIHTFGDVHIYENHKEQVDEQLSRDIKDLPTLEFKDEFHYMIDNCNHKDCTAEESIKLFLDSIQQWDSDLFRLEGYNPHPHIKAKLSTGLK